MVNWSTVPSLTQLWTNFIDSIKDRDEHNAKMDYSGDTNIPVDTVRWNATNKRFERYNGTSWITMEFGTTALANNAVTFGKIQSVSIGDRILGSTTAGGVIKEIACTSFARSILDDSNDSQVRSTLGLLDQSIATQSEAEAGTNNTKRMTSLRVAQAIENQASKLNVQSAVSLSGVTSKNIKTDFPEGVNTIEIFFQVVGVSTNGSIPIVQLSDATGWKTTGYTGKGRTDGSGATNSDNTNGFRVGDNWVSTETIIGTGILRHWNFDLWSFDVQAMSDRNQIAMEGSGYVTLDDYLTGVRIQTVTGGVTLSGSIRLRWW